MSSPVPAIPQDPDFIKAQAAHDDFERRGQAIREDLSLSDLGQAEQLDRAWSRANDVIASAFASFKQRRLARIEQLERVVPVGPDLPANASPADLAVLRQTWRTLLADARNAEEDELRQMLRDAEAFDDDQQRRAVLTVLVENGRVDLVRRWWADRSGASDQLDELVDLQTGGYGVWALKVRTAFAPVEKPMEVWNLPALQETARLAAGR